MTPRRPVSLLWALPAGTACVMAAALGLYLARAVVPAQGGSFGGAGARRSVLAG